MDLVVGELGGELVKPSHVLDGDAFGEIRGALALVAPFHELTVDTGDERFVLRRVRTDVPAPALHHVVPPRSKRGAPVDDQVARFTFVPAQLEFKDRKSVV